MINCVVNSGIPISRAIADLLLRAAQAMAHERAPSAKIKSSLCEGVISTEGKSGSMGSIMGMLFTAEIATHHGETKVEFIVRLFDLELDESNWASFDSLEEFELSVATAESKQAWARRKLH